MKRLYVTAQFIMTQYCVNIDVTGADCLTTAPVYEKLQNRGTSSAGNGSVVLPAYL